MPILLLPPDEPPKDQVRPTKDGRIESFCLTEADAIRRFFWVVAAVHASIGEIQELWAKELGLSGPQWNILLAISELGDNEGVPVNVVAKQLAVDPSFVTTQSKSLEVKGYVCRKSSSTDRRVVRLLLTIRARDGLDRLSAQRSATDASVCQQLRVGTPTRLFGELSDLASCLKRVRLRSYRAAP
jgi:DNA-binding MarR family transcriptional regulator